MNNTPEQLYRYFKIDTAIKVLENQQLMLSDWMLYNDPFEFMPASEYVKSLYSYNLKEVDAVIKELEDKMHALGIQNELSDNILNQSKGSIFEKNTAIIAAKLGEKAAMSTAFAIGSLFLPIIGAIALGSGIIGALSKDPEGEDKQQQIISGVKKKRN